MPLQGGVPVSAWADCPGNRRVPPRNASAKQSASFKQRQDTFVLWRREKCGVIDVCATSYCFCDKSRTYPFWLIFCATGDKRVLNGFFSMRITVPIFIGSVMKHETRLRLLEVCAGRDRKSVV